MDLTNLEEKKDLKSGNHIIQIYSKDREYFDTLLFFIKQGIERNEKIFCITDSCPFEEILSYLEERAEIDVQDSLDTGQLTFLNFKETYFFNGEFDAERIFVLLQKALEMTFKEGYAGIRVASEMSGILHELPILEKLLEYEAKANFYIQGNACTAICQYDRRRFEPRLLLDLFSLHPVVVLGTKIYDNRYFLSPKDYLARGLHETILDRLIQNLESSEYLEQQLSKEREFGQELLRSLPGHPSRECDLCSPLVVRTLKESAILLRRRFFPREERRFSNNLFPLPPLPCNPAPAAWFRLQRSFFHRHQ